MEFPEKISSHTFQWAYPMGVRCRYAGLGAQTKCPRKRLLFTQTFNEIAATHHILFKYNKRCWIIDLIYAYIYYSSHVSYCFVYIKKTIKWCTRKNPWMKCLNTERIADLPFVKSLTVIRQISQESRLWEVICSLDKQVEKLHQQVW